MPLANPSCENTDTLRVDEIEMHERNQEGSLKIKGSYNVSGHQAGGIYYSFEQVYLKADEVLRQIVAEQNKYGEDPKELLIIVSRSVPREDRDVFLARMGVLRKLIQQNDPSFSAHTIEEEIASGGDLFEAAYAPPSYTKRPV